MSDRDLRPLDAETAATCAECGSEVNEDEAQAQQWGYWSDGVGDLYPYCPECARREFGHRGVGAFFA